MRPAHARGWPAWALIWLSIVGATLFTALLFARLSVEGAREGLEAGLADHLVAQAGLADTALHDLPVELLLKMEGSRSAEELRSQVDRMGASSHLRALVLLGPSGEVVGHGGRWLAGAAERDLIAVAQGGAEIAGPLYRDAEGELYQTAYHPLVGHPGWVVAVEGSAATLGAVNTLEHNQRRAILAAAALAGLLGAGLAALISGPLRRLDRELSAAQPGTAPSALGDYGFREVRQVSAAGRSLLSAVRARDAELKHTHRRELAQLSRMAAEIAHEVGNPLNAVSLSVQRLATLDDPARRATVQARVSQQLAEMEGIVDRLRDLTRPLRPNPTPLRLTEVLDAVAAELPDLHLLRKGPEEGPLTTDRGMLMEILRNLAHNAAQAGARSATLSIDRGPDTISLTVADDGSGIPESEVDQVFSWFHTTKATGTGLGLPHARRMAEILGGRLDLLVTAPATFRLLLPLQAPTTSASP